MPKPTSSPIFLGALKLLSRSWRQALLAIALLVCTTLCGLSGPWILRYAVDHGLRDGQPNLQVIRNASLIFLALASTAVVMSRSHTRLTG